jgi:hypothetical protein
MAVFAAFAVAVVVELRAGSGIAPIALGVVALGQDRPATRERDDDGAMALGEPQPEAQASAGRPVALQRPWIEARAGQRP